MNSRMLICLLAAGLGLSFLSCGSRVYTYSFKMEPPLVGAYYFDGWTGRTFHATDELKKNYPDRQPMWGWVTSSPALIKEQIDLAADAGLAFFNFCWYYFAEDIAGTKEEPLNQALRLYQSAENKRRLRFCILVANHEGYLIGPEEWELATDAWIRLFQDPQYLRVNNRPYLSFFSLQTLIEKFGSPAAVKEALYRLRMKAGAAGINGVTVGVAVGPSASHRNKAVECGFDVLTSYNDHTSGFKGDETVFPISRLLEGTEKVWHRFRAASLPYIPVATLGWDARPWYPEGNTKFYTGYGQQSVYASIRSLRHWMEQHPGAVTKEKIAVLYAWNEYGEGAWLTPSVQKKDSLLQGLRMALTE